MPFLTKIPVNPYRTASVRLLGNPHLIHGAVSAGVPGDPRAERLLWRLEKDDSYRPSIIVLTSTRPDYTHMSEKYGWPESDHGFPTTYDYDRLLSRLDVGQQYHFRLTASPVQNKRRPDKLTEAQQRRQATWDKETGTAAERRLRGHRVPHRTVAQQRRWFIERARARGFEILPSTQSDAVIDTGEPVSDEVDYQVAVVERRDVRFRKRGNTNPITFPSATFEGALRISDPILFRRTLLEGFGPSKAYGQGLLTVAPLQEGGT
ncbi:type I-E CRISPR-associated protein Cas6/Cse3/CasE [Haloglycomyces albus]|uniref:type I-E CRISPR-associated protein Cas6/Cse3/CasE n=1 Tax=Haloglycomyces albus TaxID=526067 RepID=UPI00046CBAD9|nr:type I-E CRISPR-associated protein Cas6/Cse3/CasE [Haloglycomyces albus]